MKFLFGWLLKSQLEVSLLDKIIGVLEFLIFVILIAVIHDIIFVWRKK